MWPKKTIYQQPLDVNQWRQKVADATQPPKPLKVQLDSLSPRQLRSTARAERSGLRSISGNRQKLPPSAPFVKSNPTLKRKRGMSTQRGPGRPPGRGRGGLGRGTGSSRGRGKGHAGNLEEPQQHEEQEQEEQDNSDGSDFAPPGTKKVPLKNADDPQPSTAPSAKSRSRSRPRKDFDFDQQISVSQVTLKYLASCSPSVTVRKIDQVRRDFPAEVCQPTITLYNKIANVPSNLIPVSLKVSAFTLSPQVRAIILP